MWESIIWFQISTKFQNLYFKMEFWYNFNKTLNKNRNVEKVEPAWSLSLVFAVAKAVGAQSPEVEYSFIKTFLSEDCTYIQWRKNKAVSCLNLMELGQPSTTTLLAFKSYIWTFRIIILYISSFCSNQLVCWFNVITYNSDNQSVPTWIINHFNCNKSLEALINQT